MRTFAQPALTISLAAALLVGCGASQSPIGAPGAMPQSGATATDDRDGSWMSPQAKSDDLLYVSGWCCYSHDDIYVFSYPDGQLVGMLGNLDVPTGLCTDKLGDIYVTEQDAQLILEYAHGGTKPIKTLAGDYGAPVACSIDPTTGNLAVADEIGYSSVGCCSGFIAIYANASGLPIKYTAPNIYYYDSCVYDDRGNLYTDGKNSSMGGPFYAELPKGSSAFNDFTVPTSAEGYSLAWDGKYLATEVAASTLTDTIYRLTVSGSNAMIVGSTQLQGWKSFANIQFLVRGHNLVQPVRGPHKDTHGYHKVGFWTYPGGKRVRVLRGFGGHDQHLFGVALSLAPSR